MRCSANASPTWIMQTFCVIICVCYLLVMPVLLWVRFSADSDGRQAECAPADIPIAPDHDIQSTLDKPMSVKPNFRQLEVFW
jgi:hypothetical protein